jgi:hypothetical protein
MRKSSRSGPIHSSFQRPAASCFTSRAQKKTSALAARKRPPLSQKSEW